MNAIFLYCLAMAAQKTGVLVHAFVVLSNHYHAVVTDKRGNVPKFMEELNKLVAKCVNASLGRWENVWATEQPSLVKLQDPEDVLSHMVYTHTNPVSSFLVDRSIRWPGLRSDPSDLLKGSIEATRPDVFFRADGSTPSAIDLELTIPECFSNMSPRELVTTLQQRIKDKEAELRQEAQEKDIHFLGVRAIRRQCHTDSPVSREPRRNLSPRVAAKNKWRRIEALRRLKEFTRDYYEALTRWKQGFHQVIFPSGTYAMVTQLHAVCAPP